MSAIAYDTLKLSKALEAASFTPAQAEGLTKALTDASLSNFASKQDLLQVEANLSSRIAAVEASVTGLAASVTAVAASVTALEGSVAMQIAALKVDSVKWIVAAIAFNFIGTAGLIIALVKGFK